MPARITRRANGKYRLCVERGRDELGKQMPPFSKTVAAKSDKEAERLWRDFYVECQGKKVSISYIPTLDEFYQYYKKHYVEVNNLEDATKLDMQNNYDRLSMSMGHLKLDQIDIKKINAYIKQVMDDTYIDKKTGTRITYSARTIKSRVRILKTLLKQAYQWEFISSNIADKIALPRVESEKKKKVIEESDLIRILEAVEKCKIKHKLWIYLTFSLGLRRGELFGLQWTDINNNVLSISRTITVTNYMDNEGKKPKTKMSERKLYLSDDMMDLINQYKDTINIESKWIFPNRYGKATIPSAFKNFLDRLKEKHGFERLSPHMFRHTFGSVLYNRGLDMATISGRLGHANPSFTVKTYIHEIDSVEKRSAEMMSSVVQELKQKKAP